MANWRPTIPAANALQVVLRFDVDRNGLKVTSVVTPLPLPGPAGPGPLAARRRLSAQEVTDSLIHPELAPNAGAAGPERRPLSCLRPHLPQRERAVRRLGANKVKGADKRPPKH